MNETGKIIARCVIFTEVYDADGEVWRYAERQYSVGCNDVYKQALVDALIQAGEIDCFKKVGASCHDCHAIVDVHGNSLADKKFNYIHPCSTYPESDMEIDIPIMNP